jgi:hypothetical protein
MSRSVIELRLAGCRINVSRVFEIPGEIRAASRIEGPRQGVRKPNRMDAGDAAPFPHFSVTIHKTEATTPAV